MINMKIDMHTHTHYSDDAVCSPAQLVIEAKRKGLDGIAITDHNTTRAWQKVLAAGKKHGMGVILGEEVRVLHKGKKIGEVIGLFLNEEILPGEFHVVRDKIKDQGGIMVTAHPFDYFRSRFKMIEQFKGDMEAIEVFNARVVLNWFNNKAFSFAQENRFPMTAGTDCHCGFEVGNAYTIADVSDAEGFRSAILRKKTQVWGRKTNPMIHTISTLAKLRIISRDRPRF